jgi:fluoroquinolone resistance protein
MSEVYVEDDKFESIDFTTQRFAPGEYDNCDFINCNFANVDCSFTRFVDCRFTGCNFSMSKLLGTSLNSVTFEDSKIIGINFETCNEFSFSVSFQNCILNFSSFYKRVLKKTLFRDCTLLEVDLTDADLAGTIFDKCNFDRAKFDNTNLEKADLRTSFNYSIDPERNKLKKAKFSRDGLAGLLEKYDLNIS